MKRINFSFFRYWFLSILGILFLMIAKIGECQSLKTIDLLILYSEDAQNSSAQTDKNILLRIAEAVDDVNISFLNSNVDARIRVVHQAMTNGFSDLSTATANRIALQDPNDGILDYVHSLRNQYFADIVVLIVEYPITSTSGVGNAQVCGEPASVCNSMFETAAFASIHWEALDQRTLAHELGHVMGLHHERASFAPSSVPIGAAPDAYGYRRWDFGNNSFSTIMGTAINTSIGLRRIPYFSNPNINESLTGAPMGVEHNVSPSSSANSARVLKEITSLVSNKWRENLVGLKISYNGSNNLIIDDNLGDKHLRGINTTVGGFTGLVFKYSGVSELSIDQSGFVRALGFSEHQSSFPTGSLRFSNTQSGKTVGCIATDGIMRAKGIISPFSIP